MTDTPRSRSVSRGSTPALFARPSPSRPPMRPSLHPSPSMASLQLHNHNATSSSVPSDLTLTLPPNSADYLLDSSASSVINVEPAEGILIHDIDIDANNTDGEDIEAIDKVRQPEQGEESKKLLRDQLRKSLNHKVTPSEVEVARARQAGKFEAVEDLPFPGETLYTPREYFVLTDAGKPVYISRPGGADQDGMASTIGIMQALISVFLDDNDKLRCINAGKTRITFLLRPPLYYACVSSWGEPESVTRAHLEYLHFQILSIVTGSQLKRIFERRNNFDLRRLLNGAEPFMNSLLMRLETDMAMSTSSLHCLKMEPSLRKRLADALIPTTKMKDMLYIVLIANNRVVTLLRPKKHSIHPADLHILLNTIHSPSIYNSPANASWIPICLPKFNPSGFVNSYITFLRKDEAVDLQHPSTRPTSPASEEVSTTSGGTTSDEQDPQESLNESGIALVCVTGGGDLEVIRNWCNSVISKLTTDGTLNALINAYRHKETDYSVSELGIPGLRHFIYKSRTQVQITLPNFEDPYHLPPARKRLTTLYQILHDAIHAKSGQESGLKLQYIRTDSESVLGWITQPFELYITLSPLLPKSAAVGAANAVARWVKREEAQIVNYHCRSEHGDTTAGVLEMLTRRGRHTGATSTFCSSTARSRFKASTMAMSLLNLQRLVAPRILPSIPSLTRSLIIRPEAPKRNPIPPPRDPAVFRQGARPAEAIKTPEDFLKAIGRSSETKLSPPSWEELWKMDGHAMKEAGLGVRDRRYILWCMEKFRLGFPVREFAHEPPPKKTVRGWGPKVQNGKRIRSRRIKDKTRKPPTKSFFD
ncbi:hypothetical protein D9619_006994 [Psilocybe cf. subviscida]|uniref:Vacuolar fusion protein MON1 n=1 Tax=Psilocybe cf. subviscida TaxID=2480587 RepID=A0A8H5B2F5_9AGAR|nr:hypothetical protein D9619_006994 [Psilocybe cf. subviscida]